ncbi:MAG TPA: LytR C-terminal domain-containing protein [Mycobacteriales bacterium]|nr:LytR C-terminal domain-containing protein [Mycobacteriales bacterium]
MRIPDGDLVPARRHRYRGGYGRSRLVHRRRLLGLVLVLLLAAAAAWYLTRDDGSPVASAGSRCPVRASASPSPTTAAVVLPAPRQVRVVVLNGTARQGLAKVVGQQLRARGFVVVTEDNYPSAVTGASLVRSAPAGRPAATLLARHVLGARLLPGAAAANTVQLVLGSGYQRLATPAEVAAAGTPAPPRAPAPTASACAA